MRVSCLIIYNRWHTNGRPLVSNASTPELEMRKSKVSTRIHILEHYDSTTRSKLIPLVSPDLNRRWNPKFIPGAHLRRSVMAIHFALEVREVNWIHHPIWHLLVHLSRGQRCQLLLLSLVHLIEDKSTDKRKEDENSEADSEANFQACVGVRRAYCGDGGRGLL